MVVVFGEGTAAAAVADDGGGPSGSGGNEMALAEGEDRMLADSADAMDAVDDEEEDETFVPQGDVLGDGVDMGSATLQSKPGIVEEIVMENFMNHAKTKITLGPTVNFVIGQNGSGKSAILAALCVCLGASTRSATARGKTLKEYIRNGQQSARVSVRLNNRGKEGFEPDRYGDTITVERRINAASSTYLLKSQHGKVVSRNRRDLVAMLDHFHIQVDNAAVIMHQDTSRELLTQSTPARNYEFFLKATSLAKMKEAWLRVNSRVEMLKKMVERKGEALGHMEEHVRERKAELDEVEAVREREATLVHDRKRLLWAMVREAEVLMEKRRAKVARVQRKLAKIEESVAEHTAKRAAVTAESKALVDALEERSRATTNESTAIREAKEALRDAKRAIRTVETELRMETRKRGDWRAQFDLLVRELEQERARIAQDEQDREHGAERLAEIRQRVAAVESEAEEARAEVERVDEEVDRSEREVVGVWRERKAAAQRVVREAETRVRNSGGGGGNNAAMWERFGKGVGTLMAALEREKHRFSVPPIGPLGNYISAAPQYQRAVENVCDAVLSSFAVSTVRDKDTLFRVAQEARVRVPDIIIQRYSNEPYRVRAPQGPPDVPTLLSVMKIKGAYAHNVLVDQVNVEKWLVVRDYARGKALMHGARPVPGSRGAVTLQGQQLSVRSGVQSTQNAKRIVQSRLASNREEIHRAAQQQLEVARRDLRRVEEQAQEHLSTHAALRRELNEARHAETSVRHRLRELKGEESDLQNDMEDRVQGGNSLADMEEDKARVTREIAACDARIADFEAKLNKRRVEAEPHEGTLKGLMERFRATKAGIEAAQEAFAKNERKARGLTDTIGELTAKREAVANRLGDHTDILEQCERDVREAMERAREDAPERIDVAQSVGEIRAEIEAKQVSIREELDRRGKRSTEEIARAYAEGKAGLDQVQRHLRVARDLTTRLEKMRDTRRVKWYALRRTSARLAHAQFRRNMAAKGHLGSLRFAYDNEHGAGDLNIVVDLDAATMRNTQAHAKASEIARANASAEKAKGGSKAKGGKAKGAAGGKKGKRKRKGEEGGPRSNKTLSGGERSFSTLSFVMSLFELSDSPFRALDEFDVFMDEVHRRVSLNALVRECLDRRNHQAIFITPNDVSQLRRSLMDQINVFRLEPPQRMNGGGAAAE